MNRQTANALIEAVDQFAATVKNILLNSIDEQPVTPKTRSHVVDPQWCYTTNFQKKYGIKWSELKRPAKLLGIRTKMSGKCTLVERARVNELIATYKAMQEIKANL